jgi:hypothetical protein
MYLDPKGTDSVKKSKKIHHLIAYFKCQCIDTSYPWSAVTVLLN